MHGFFSKIQRMYVCKDSAAPQHTRVHAHTGPRRLARAPACHRPQTKIQVNTLLLLLLLHTVSPLLQIVDTDTIKERHPIRIRNHPYLRGIYTYIYNTKHNTVTVIVIYNNIFFTKT